MKAVVAAFNQEKALVGAFSVITNLRMDLRFKLHTSVPSLSDPLTLGGVGLGGGLRPGCDQGSALPWVGCLVRGCCCRGWRLRRCDAVSSPWSAATQVTHPAQRTCNLPSHPLLKVKNATVTVYLDLPPINLQKYDLRCDVTSDLPNHAT